MAQPTSSFLYNKFLQGLCTQEELDSLFQLFGTGNEQEIKKMILAEMQVEEDNPATQEEQEKLDHLKQLIDQHINTDKKQTRRLWPRIAAAASIILALSAGTYYLTHQAKPIQLANNPELISPAKKGITLTLANGQIIRLDQRHLGKTKNADGTQIEQTTNGIRYDETGTPKAEEHTLSNNSSNKYSLILADGTEVYLDVASSITYPVEFTGKERRVAIVGQAYFKVKHNTRRPFFVTTKAETVEDIGTEFNVDAYPDDQELKTTLINGSVRVNVDDNSPIMLKPGEQSRISGDKLTVVSADMEAVTAWMQGKLVFNHEGLESIMTKVARIYDVQFIWQDEQLKKLKFNGAVSRTKKLNTVLNFFRKTGEVDFLVEGKTVKVFRHKK
ncbi:FecR domain-containing protein [Mucilaginibacter sp.]|uniref:FecR family protein n=1 Tax=Mucilaginibacter sp. TaxID=1882438 RepID=UPI003263904E